VKNRKKEPLLLPVPLTPEQALRAAMETPLPKRKPPKKSPKKGG